MASGKERQMDYKWIGALLIVAGCGGFGFSMAASHRLQETSLRDLIRILDYMACELQFRMTPLPELCRGAGKEFRSSVGQIFTSLGDELDSTVSADVASCMETVLKKSMELPPLTRDNLILLGESLGRFDMSGQLNGLESVRSSCRTALDSLSENREVRLRNYQTLGLCAGAALAIILI